MSDLECMPLKTLNDVDKWTSEGISNKMRQASVSLQRKYHTDESVPRTLVCHDMRGGYIEDRFVYMTSTLLIFDL